MYYHISGIVSDLEPYVAVIDCGGVGYLLNVSLNTLSRLKVGERARLYVSESIREDSFELYGFFGKSEKKCFDMLVGVSGVGPKAALSILSSSTPEALAMAVINGDERALTVAPGIGKKIAQRVILELKDKLAKENAAVGLPAPAPAGAPGAAGPEGKLADAAAALGVLGYGPAEISAALRKLETDDMSVEDIIKAALRSMMK